MEKLVERASGLRHLRWAREVLATLDAHYEHDARLAGPDRDAVLDEAILLRRLVVALSAAVKPYRDFLERRRVQFRGMQRVGRFLCDRARSDGESDEAVAEASAIAEGFDEALVNLEARERRPLKAAVRAAVGAVRAGLDGMDARLEGQLSRAFVESLYPPLTRDRSIVADDDDDDDDATSG